MSRMETVVWKKLVCVCWFWVRLGGNVVSVVVNSDVEEVDWRGGDIWRENDVRVLFVNAVEQIV